MTLNSTASSSGTICCSPSQTGAYWLRWGLALLSRLVSIGDWLLIFSDLPFVRVLCLLYRCWVVVCNSLLTVFSFVG
jgi:hypothetical protein